VVVLEASRAGVDDTLRRLLMLELVGTAGAVALATLLFDRAARSALRPLDRVVETARAIGGGRTGERLRPQRTDTELGRMAEAFDEMLDSLELAMEAVRASEGRSRRFLADAAHQLRTPVAGVQASAEALLRFGVTPDAEELLVNLVRETTRMGKLMTGLLRVARLDEPGGLELRPCDLREVCLQEVGRLRQRAPGLRVTVTGSPPHRIPADPAALGEALANLLDNAHRHAASQVTVVMGFPDESAEVRITDDGPGLHETEVEQAFERFVSLDRQGGSGLGLPIARAVARAHGGDLTYEGGAFVFRLPRR